MHAPHESLRLRRNVGALKRRRRDETVASPGHGYDKSSPSTSIANCPTEHGDRYPEAAFVNIGVRPYSFQELALANELTRALGEYDQGIEGTAPEAQPPVPL